MSTPPLQLDRIQAPWWRHRVALLLIATVIFAAGFFSGAVLFGIALLKIHTP